MSGKSRSRRSKTIGLGLGVIDAAGVERDIATPDGVLLSKGGFVPVLKVIEIAHDTPGIATGVDLLTLEPGEVILGVFVRVTTGWDSSTASLSLGSNSELDDIIDEQDVKTAGLVTLVSGSVPTAVVSAATTYKVKVDTTGTATKGKAEVMVLYSVATGR